MVAPPAKNVNQTIDGSTVMVMTVDGIPDAYMYESSIASVTLVESLLTPSIHTTVEVQDPVYWAPDGQVKDLNRYKGKTLAFNLYKKDLDASLEVNQVIYRIDNRKLMNMQVEGYQIHAIDNDTLINATGRMARAWVCKTPSTIVEGNSALREGQCI
jgi:hypothetical protein